MAAPRPKSMVTMDTDVNLDFLTKEEKEALLSKKMDMIRQKNKALSERHKLIEADKKKAEEAGQAVKPSVDSQSLPAEGPAKPRGRGRGQPNQRDANKYGRERPKSHGDFRDTSNYEPIVDTSDLASYKHEYRGKGRPSGGGGGGGGGDRDSYSHPKTPQNKRKGPPKDEGPPPDPTFNPLADRRRADRLDRKEERESNNDHRRHPRNFGGGAELNKVKQNMRTQREKEKERPQTKKPLEMVMTGKERRNHEEWKAERDRYDNERIQRQLDDKGTWRRAWDAEKLPDEIDDSAMNTGRMEPAKRPAGRIGSGRFDRGDRDERPRSGGLPTKGGPSQAAQQHQEHSSPPKRVQQPHQQTEKSHQPDHPQTSTQGHQPQGVRDSGSGRGGGSRGGRGRGRGRGRGFGSGGQGSASSGERAPRPRTWSGGDDRLVECQKQQLLVKFDNTAGDNSVEVEYDDVDAALSPPSTPKSGSQSSMTTPRHGPTGRTPNQTGQKSYRRSEGGNKPQSKSSSSRSGRGKGGRPSSTHDDWNPEAHSGRVRSTTSSSHSHSFGDSEEWEDCTTSEDDPNANTDLHLECTLNPEAPEFLPTSPDFLKTPPGHVKVLNWTASAKPPSSQGSATSPRVLSQSSNPPTSPTSAPQSSANQNLTLQSPSSSISSPGSSASTKAAKRREELDQMPEADQPFDPTEIFGAAEPGQIPPTTLEVEDDEDDDNFEDSVEVEEKLNTSKDDVTEIETISTSLEAGKETKSKETAHIPSKISAVEDNEGPDAAPEVEDFDDATSDTVLEAEDIEDDAASARDVSTTAGQGLDLASELATAAQKESLKDSTEDPLAPHQESRNLNGDVESSSDSLSSETITESQQSPSADPSSKHTSESETLADNDNNNVDPACKDDNAETFGGESADSIKASLTKDEEGERNEPTAEILSSP